MLCNACKTLTVQRLLQQATELPPGSRQGWNQAGYLILHESFTDLKASAKNGCPNCDLFLSRFGDEFGGLHSVAEKTKELEHDGSDVPVIAFIVMVVWRDHKGWNQHITKLLLQIGTEPWKPGDEDRMTITFRVSQPRGASKSEEFAGFYFRYTELDHDLGSDVNFRVVKDWLHDCSTTHDSTLCPRIMDHKLPTRLIDVQTTDDFPHPRLFIASKGQKGRYLALSHCWGPSVKGERVTTETGNIEDRKKGIPLISMPANFRDAVVVTRKLGFRFVWIDSLCIIQNSEEDWAAESARMGDIYMNASLTIAAAAAKDSDGGMLGYNYQGTKSSNFKPSEWFMVDRKKVNRYALNEPAAEVEKSEEYGAIGLTDKATSPTVSIRPWGTYSDLEENWYRCVVVGPLAHRGWTLQERTLSYRTLYYGKRQIYWQCPSSRKAADGEDVPPTASTSAWNQSSDHSEWPDFLSLECLNYAVDSKATLQFHQTWRNILTIYVSRKLTKQKDKLPALAGMAAIAHRFTGDQYIAGFWRKDLLVSLIWTPVPIEAKGGEKMDYVIHKPQWELKKPFLTGPSWSWCSADVQDRLLFWGSSHEDRIWQKNDAEIVDVDVTLISSNPFGSVEKGQLLLRGLTYERWDGRVKGWNPLVQGFYGAWDFVSEHTCWQSSRYNTHKSVLWDYPPRHGIRILPKLLRLFAQILLSLIAVIVWHSIDFQARLKEIHDSICPYCVRCLSLHILSIVEPYQYRREGRSDRFNNVKLWSLILEPVKGRDGVYRRIGIASKDVSILEAEFEEFRKGVKQPSEPGIFTEWKYRTVTII